MELRIFVGLQASGKSTFYRTHFATTHTQVSKDLLRNNRRLARRQNQLIEEAFKAGQSIVVDNTNPSVEDRAELIRLGHLYGARVIGYYFAAQVRECLERNRQRTGGARVPDIALFATRKRLILPSYSEGFDALFYVHTNDDGTFTVRECSREE